MPLAKTCQVHKGHRGVTVDRARNLTAHWAQVRYHKVVTGQNSLHSAQDFETRLAAVAQKKQQGPARKAPAPIPLRHGREQVSDDVAAQVRQSKRKAFLAAYAEQGNVGHACEQAHIARGTVYKWLEHDERFALEFKQAELRAVERLEQEAFRRGVQGTQNKRTTYYHGRPVGHDVKTEYSDALLTLLLRARAPDKYRESIGLNVSQVIKSIQGFDPSEVLGVVTSAQNAGLPGVGTRPAGT